MQNFPEIVLQSLAWSSINVMVRYRGDSLPTNAAYPITVEFFCAVAGGGGWDFIGSDGYTAAVANTEKTATNDSSDGSGLLPAVPVAMDAPDNKREFSVVIGETIFAGGFETPPLVPCP